MIKINLCPEDELLSPTWFVPDLVALIGVGVAAYFGLQYYLGTIQDQVDALNQEISNRQAAIAQLRPDIERYKNLSREKEELNVKITALRSITVSRISKYKPVIVLEHLQNLKPEGTWYSSFRYGVPDGEGFEITGAAFDNILAAELMTALRSTESQEVDASDLRTQVYFTGLALDQTSLGAGVGFPDIANQVTYTIRGKVEERGLGASMPKATPPAGGAPLSLEGGHDDKKQM